MTEDRNFSSHHFLVADDKAGVRSIVMRMLQRGAVESVREAASGVSALDVLVEPKSKIDCVLCDWNMEPMNGLQVLSLIRRGAVKGIPRDLRIIMLTAHADPSLVKIAASLDANGYLIKPVAYDKLVKAVETAFTKSDWLKPAAHYAAVKVPSVPPGSPGSGDTVRA